MHISISAAKFRHSDGATVASSVHQAAAVMGLRAGLYLADPRLRLAIPVFTLCLRDCTLPKKHPASGHILTMADPVIESETSKRPSRSFRSFIWDTDTHLKSHEERVLLRKLDWSILTIGCLGFFMKYLDQVSSDI